MKSFAQPNTVVICYKPKDEQTTRDRKTGNNRHTNESKDSVTECHTDRKKKNREKPDRRLSRQNHLVQLTHVMTRVRRARMTLNVVHLQRLDASRGFCTLLPPQFPHRRQQQKHIPTSGISSTISRPNPAHTTKPMK